MSKTALSRMLGQFGILSGTIRLPSGKTPKGYHLSAFMDVFERYLLPESATSPQTINDGGCGGFQNATTVDPVAPSKTPQTNNHRHCGGVAFSAPPPDEYEAGPILNGAQYRSADSDNHRPALGPDGDSLDDFR